MPINVPIHVSTQGIVTCDPTLIATQGFIDGLFRSDTDAVSCSPGNVGALITDPRREWYTRRNPSDPLFGPLNWMQADANARALSADEDEDGLAELLTFVGSQDRPGDPVKHPSVLFIVFMYIRGKRTLGGSQARFQSVGDGCLPNVISPVSGHDTQLVLAGVPINLGGVPIVFDP